MTIRLRLTLAFVILFALLMFAKTAFTNWGFRQAMETEARHMVNSRVEAVMDYLKQYQVDQKASGERFTWADPEALPRAFSDDGMFLQVTTPQGKLLAHSPNLQPDGLPVAKPGIQAIDIAAPNERDPVPAMLSTHELRLPDQSLVVIQAALPTTYLELAIGKLMMMQSLGVAFGLLLALAAGYALAGRALAPAAALNDEMEALSASDLHRRLSAPEHPRDEMERLAATFNRLLDRIQEAFDARRRFVADASHELKSPLTSILGYHQLLSKRGEAHPELAKEWLRIASSETERLIRLVDELLLLAREDAQPDAERDHHPLDLKALAQDVVGSMSELYSRLSLDGCESVWVRGNADHLGRLLRNLIDNALRATQGKGDVRVSIGSEDGTALMIVSDSGTGIPPEAMPHLFDRFYRADVARDRTRGGAGLGLAICQAIAEGHRGRIEVQSEQGKGTTFTVRFPAVASLSQLSS